MDLEKIYQKKIEQINQGIEDSPLPTKAKDDLSEAVKENETNIKNLIISLQPGGSRYQGKNYDGIIYRHLVENYFVPVFKENKVLPEHGRDLGRHIYKCLGGLNKVKYESE